MILARFLPSHMENLKVVPRMFCNHDSFMLFDHFNQNCAYEKWKGQPVII